jgi:signal transduction histidine kinase
MAMFWMLGLVAVAVALGVYPMARRLTQRLEQLQKGVEQWGHGDLSARITVQGRDEVADLAEHFNQAAARIEELVKSHEALLTSNRSLLANASHELRSPLARIRMSLELMGSDMDAPAAKEITRSIGELNQLIDEILLASRLDAHEADMGTVESLDLTGLVAEECARGAASLECTAGSPTIVVHGIAKLLRRAVRNLLENAGRHGRGQVQVHLLQSPPWVIIRVCDRGPGVPENLRERIFEPFFRLPGASETDGGVGLGLALVRSIAQRHHGHVYCEAQPGGGACFVLKLPLQSAPK